VCICVYVRAYTYVHIYTYIHNTKIHTSTYIYTHTNKNVHAHTHTHTHTHKHTHTPLFFLNITTQALCRACRAAKWKLDLLSWARFVKYQVSLFRHELRLTTNRHAPIVVVGDRLSPDVHELVLAFQSKVLSTPCLTWNMTLLRNF